MHHHSLRSRILYSVTGSIRLGALRVARLAAKPHTPILTHTPKRFRLAAG